MKTLYFNVSGQKLIASDIPDDLVKGTRNYLQCAFSFEGQDWIGCKVVAEFNGAQAIPVRNRVCMVPNDAADKPYIKVRLIGQRDSYRIITNETIVKQGVS